VSRARGRLIVEYQKEGVWLTCLGDDGDTFRDVVAAIKRQFPETCFFRSTAPARYECTCGYTQELDGPINAFASVDDGRITITHERHVAGPCPKCRGVAVLLTR
jgi:hypothetical protein